MTLVAGPSLAYLSNRLLGAAVHASPCPGSTRSAENASSQGCLRPTLLTYEGPLDADATGTRSAVDKAKGLTTDQARW